MQAAMGPLYEVLRQLKEDGCALGEAALLARLEAALGGRQRIIELRIAHILETLEQLAVVGVDALVRHRRGDLDMGVRGLSRRIGIRESLGPWA